MCHTIIPPAFAPLNKFVVSSPSEQPWDLHFATLGHDLAGNYSCEVTSEAGATQQAEYDLRVIGERMGRMGL